MAGGRPHARAAANRAHYKKLMKEQLVSYKTQAESIAREHDTLLLAHAARHTSRLERHALDHLAQMESIRDARRVTSELTRLNGFKPQDSQALMGAHYGLVSQAKRRNSAKVKVRHVLLSRLPLPPSLYESSILLSLLALSDYLSLSSFFQPRPFLLLTAPPLPSFPLSLSSLSPLPLSSFRSIPKRIKAPCRSTKRR